MIRTCPSFKQRGPSFFEREGESSMGSAIKDGELTEKNNWRVKIWQNGPFRLTMAPDFFYT